MLLLTVMIGISVIGDDIPERSTIYFTLLFIIVGSIILGLLFVFLEHIYIPYRKKKIQLRLKKKFKANLISDGIYLFQHQHFNIYLILNFQLKMSQIAGYMERVEIHLIKEEIGMFIRKINTLKSTY